MLGRLGFCLTGDVDESKSLCCSAEVDAVGLRETGCAFALLFSELPWSCSCSADIAAPQSLSSAVLCPSSLIPRPQRVV